MVILILVLRVFIASESPAQNVVANADFDTHVASWTIGSQEFVESAWSASDVDGSPVSGSLGRDTLTPAQTLDVWNLGVAYLEALATAQSARIHAQNRSVGGGLARALFDEVYVLEP